MTFKYRYRKQIIIGIVIFIILSSVVFSIVYSLNNKSKDEEFVIPEVKKKEKKEEKEKIEEYSVDIKGEVNSPGIYTLNSGSRVIDVINKASGLTENADTSVINLSRKITDEMVIIIYSHEQVKDFSKTKEVEQQVIKKCEAGEEYSLKNDACIKIEESSSTELNGKVSINTASLEELMTLPGIGESKANDIIKYREENGNFNSIEDIKNVSGIGDSLFAKIKENITV